MLNSLAGRRRIGAGLVLLLSSSLPCAAQAEWKALSALERGGARVSASVLDLGTGTVLQKLHDEKRLSPASVTKLVVAAAALDVWPADKTFETRVLASGPIRDGRVAGDLIINSDGDATFDHRDLWLLAGQVRAAGIRSIGGSVVAYPVFGPLGCDNADRCEALASSDTAFNVPLASLGVDFGTWCVQVQATTPGQPALLRSCAGVALPVPVEGTITTRTPKPKESFWVGRDTRDGLDHLRVGGVIAPGETQQIFRAMSDPALGTAQLLQQMLAELGVSTTGKAHVHYGPPIEATSEIASAHGAPLRDQLARMLRFSNNYIADLLTLDIAAARSSKPPKQLADASAVLAGHLKPVKGGSLPRLYSGSGLTPENELSAADLVNMLHGEYRDAETFSAFYGGMVVPRQAPFAFLRGGSTAWLDRVALKTGTMNDPVSVCAVAGYLRRRDGGWMAFAILVNGSPTKRHVPLYKSMEAIRADIDDLLARY